MMSRPLQSFSTEKVQPRLGLHLAGQAQFDRPEVGQWFACSNRPQRLLDTSALNLRWPVTLRLHVPLVERPKMSAQNYIDYNQSLQPASAVNSHLNTIVGFYVRQDVQYLNNLTGWSVVGTRLLSKANEEGGQRASDKKLPPRTAL